jgi:hypothetical protein
LYVCNLIFLCRTLCTVGLGIPNSKLCWGINLIWAAHERLADPFLHFLP